MRKYTSEQLQILADQFDEKGRCRVATILRLTSSPAREVLEINHRISIPNRSWSCPSRPYHRKQTVFGGDVINAKLTIAWYKNEYPKLLKKLQQRDELVQRGIDGDARAVLATPEGRAAVWGKVEKNRSGISDWTNRKSSKEAQQIVLERIQRREDRQIAEAARTAKPQKYLDKYLSRLNKFALYVGEAYHENISNLYTSKRAYIGIDTAGEVVWDNDAYSKSYGYGAKFTLAGVSIRGDMIHVYTSRQTLKAEIPIPKNWWACKFHGLLDGDLWCVRAKKIGTTVVYNRFGWKRKKIVKTGVTCQIEVPEQLRKHWPASVDGSGIYSEHGETVAECKESFRHKCRLAEEVKAKQANSAKLERAKRLIVRLCQNLPVTHEHRKACGYCDAGTKAFLDRYGLSGRDTVTLAELKKTGDSSALKPAYVAAEKLAQKLVEKVGA